MDVALGLQQYPQLMRLLRHSTHKELAIKIVNGLLEPPAAIANGVAGAAGGGARRSTISDVVKVGWAAWLAGWLAGWSLPERGCQGCRQHTHTCANMGRRPSCLLGASTPQRGDGRAEVAVRSVPLSRGVCGGRGAEPQPTHQGHCLAGLSACRLLLQVEQLFRFIAPLVADPRDMGEAEPDDEVRPATGGRRQDQPRRWGLAAAAAAAAPAAASA